MKTFIVNVYKNKKWITLGLSILCLFLLLFPATTVYKYKPDKVTGEAIRFQLPFIIAIFYRLKYTIKYILSYIGYDGIFSDYAKHRISTETLLPILVIVFIVLTIVSLILLFKKKKFYFIPSLIVAFLVMLIAGIQLDYYTYTGFRLVFYPTTYIFLALLVLDIVYLCLERHYVHGGQEKLAARKLARQTKQEAALKQSPEYRIEQLEKELQDLKSQVKSDDDRQ